MTDHFFSVAQKQLPLGAELQLALNLIPAHTWYATPSGALTFLNERGSDYLGLPQDHPLRFGLDTGAEWDSHIPLLHPDNREQTRRVWSDCLGTGCAGQVSFRVRNTEGGYRWFLSRAEPVRASDETLLYWIGINLDIEDRKQAEFYLGEGQRLAHMGSWAFNASGFDYWSPELFRIHGLDPCGKAPTVEEYIELVHPEDREFVVQTIQKMLAEHRGFDFTKRIVRPDGEIRHVRCVGTVATPGGAFGGFLGTGMDVTEQEQLSEELRRSQAHLTDAQELSRTGSVGMKVSTRQLFWSDEAARIYGFPPGTEPTADLVLQRVHPDDVGLFKNVLERAAQGGSSFDFENRLLMPDGSIKYLRNLSHSLTDETGNEEVVGAVMDVTESKIAEETIRRSEAYLAEAQRLSHTGSFGWRPDSGEIVWSDETYRIFEYDSTLQPTVDSVVQRVHPDDRTLAQQVIDHASQTGTDFEHEYRLLLADGRVKHVHAIARAAHSASGNREFIGAVTDITEHKTAEEKIREQEAELRQMLDFAPQLIAVLGPHLERLYANRVALAYYGVSLDEWRQRGPEIEFHPDDFDRVKAHFHRWLISGAAYELEMEKRMRGGDGTYRWFLFRYNPLRDDQGQIVRFYIAGTDIEDRKRNEERLQEENVALREEIDKTSMFEEIVGTSSALQTVLAGISKVAPTDSTVLITGETGTGKELVARAIHRRSGRTSRAFVSVNCAAIPRDLVLSELFGHEKGAFTGALQRRLGRFELADGGTIFLDEVGELLPDTQVALLRVLQERELERVGGRQPIRVDVRVIAATNRDLNAAVVNGTFRQDLFYRLNVFPIEVPSLRERKEDLLMLVEYFVQRYSKRAGKNIRSIDQKALDLLRSYDWPGNIRELQNIIERSVILTSGEVFSVDESWFSKDVPPRTSRGEATAQFRSEVEPRTEREIIEAALAESRGRVSGTSGAASKLGIPPSTLDHRIKALKIDKKQFKFL